MQSFQEIFSFLLQKCRNALFFGWALINFIFLIPISASFGQIQSNNQTQFNTKNSADKLAEQLNNAAAKAPSEIIYIKTNKDIYETGEDLWFRAFMLQSKTLVPSQLSNTLYVELQEEQSGKIVWQEKYKRQQEIIAGQIYLADSLKAGHYLIKAYTHASLYADSLDFFAVRKIKVVKDFTALTQIQPNIGGSNSSQKGNANKIPLHIAILPEGGQLIQGVQGLLAIKVTDALGMPVTASGTLLENGLALTPFTTLHAGMGSLPLLPKSESQYQLQFQVNGLDTLVELPKINTQGLSLRLLAQDASHLEFLAAQPENAADQMVYLRGQYRGETKVMAYGLLKKELRFKIPIQEFDQQGIAEFTLFDHNGLPQAERLVYVQALKKLYISIDTLKEQYALREKGEMTIKVLDESGNSVNADLAVSIYDKFYHSPSLHTTIQDYYGLSSQLRGRIYNPAYYFDEKNENRAEALDLLLLTQGWRKYTWSETNLAFHGAKNTSLLTDGISGSILYTRRLKQAPNDNKYLMAYTIQQDGSLGQNLLVESDTLGKFIINPTDLQDRRGYLYLKPFGQEAYVPKLQLDNPFKSIEGMMKNKKIQYALEALALPVNPTQQQAPTLDSRILRLQEVEINAKRSTSGFRDKYMGKLDSLYNDKFNPDFLCLVCNILNCHHHKTERTKKPIAGKTYTIRVNKEGRMLVPGDEDKVYYGDKFITYTPPSVKEEDLIKLLNIYRIKGYYPNMEFYSPNYDSPQEEQPHQDSRNALLWIPSIRTNEKGEAKISFFTSDIKSSFVIEIEGADSNGLLGHQKLQLIVSKSD